MPGARPSGVRPRRIPRGLGWLLAILVLAYAGYDLLFSRHGYLVYRREQAELAKLKAEVRRLTRERRRLASAVHRLKHDPEALEELAHRELGYVHKDEYMLILPEGGPASGAGNRDRGKK